MEQAKVTPLSEADECGIKILNSIRYHEDREAFFGMWSRIFDFAVVASGMGAVLTLVPATGSANYSGYIGALAGLIGALKLVFAIEKRECLHADLRRKYRVLFAALIDGEASKIEKQRRQIQGEEPPLFYAVDAVAFNAAQRAYGRPAATLKKISFFPSLFRNIRRYSNRQFVDADGD